MRRALILAFILATGCSGDGGKRDGDVSPTASWSLKESDKYESAHPSATPSRHESQDVGSSILDGVFDVLFGGN